MHKGKNHRFISIRSYNNTRKNPIGAFLPEKPSVRLEKFDQKSAKFNNNYNIDQQIAPPHSNY